MNVYAMKQKTLWNKLTPKHFFKKKRSKRTFAEALLPDTYAEVEKELGSELGTALPNQNPKTKEETPNWTYQ